MKAIARKSGGAYRQFKRLTTLHCKKGKDRSKSKKQKGGKYGT